MLVPTSTLHLFINPALSEFDKYGLIQVMDHIGAVPEASACAVSGSVSGLVSAPSCPGLGSRPWTSSFTVYTNNSIYKEITPGKNKDTLDMRQ